MDTSCSQCTKICFVVCLKSALLNLYKVFWALSRFALAMTNIYLSFTVLRAMVAEPHLVNADPDPSILFDADPNPTFRLNADPHPLIKIIRIWMRIWIPLFFLMRIRIRLLDWMRIRMPPKMIRIGDNNCSAGPQRLYSERPRPSLALFWASKALEFRLWLGSSPAFPSKADPASDPASQNNQDPEPRPWCTK